jgi:hypothetical protein
MNNQNAEPVLKDLCTWTTRFVTCGASFIGLVKRQDGENRVFFFGPRPVRRRCECGLVACFIASCPRLGNKLCRSSRSGWWFRPCFPTTTSLHWNRLCPWVQRFPLSPSFFFCRKVERLGYVQSLIAV